MRVSDPEVDSPPESDEGGAGHEPHHQRLWLRALQTLKSDHLPFSSLLLAGIVVRAIAILSIRPAQLLFGDSIFYVDNARRLVPSGTRPIGYALFLRFLGVLGHGLQRAVVVQHVLALITATLLYVALRRLGVGRWTAAIGAAPLLLDAYQINIEHQILSETLFEFLLVAGVVLLVWRSAPSRFMCAGAGALFAAAAVTRSIGVAAIVPAVVFLATRRYGVVRLASLVLGFLLPITGYAVWFQANNHKFGLTNFDGIFLYGRVAPFVSCSNLSVPAYESTLCDPTPPAMRPGGNHYVWDRLSPLRRLHDLPPGKDLNGVAGDFARRAIMQQPGRYARVVLSDLLHYFELIRHTGPRDQNLRAYKFSSVATYDRDRIRIAVETKGPPIESPRVAAWGIRFLSGYQRIVYPWGPLLLAAIVLAGLGIGLGRDQPVLRWACLMFFLIGIANLAGPIATTLFDYRYLLPAVPFIGAAAALGSTIVLRRSLITVPSANRDERRGLADSSPARHGENRGP